MPTYAYKCRECGNAFDIQQAFTDDALTVCPSCGGELRKVFGTVGVTFNGSGFYRTDSRAQADSKGSKGSSSEASESTKKKEPAAAGSTSSSKDGASHSGSGSSAQTSTTKAPSPTP